MIACEALDSPGTLPSVDAWRAAAQCHLELFAPLDAGARIGFIARAAPSRMLVWQAGDAGVEVRIEPFTGYAATGADIVLAADADCLSRLRAADDRSLVAELRAGIRAGNLVCYVLKPRCELEQRGYDELLDALGYAFMGACR